MTNSEMRERLLSCLGGPWPEACPLDARVTKTEQRDGYRLQWISYNVEAHERVESILMIPDGVTASHPAPGICVWHQHNGQWDLGKSEPAGLSGNPMHFTGLALVRLGYVVLCPDAVCFEDRQDSTGKLTGNQFERFEFLRHIVSGRSLAWKNILDMRRAVDCLCSREEVRSDTLGCYGHSMGSTFTWLVGPWEPRLTCLVGNCCLPTYAAIHRTHIIHCFPNFVPGFQQFGDTPDIASLIAPRPLHLNFGETDAGSPIDEVRAGVETIRQAYDRVGAGEQFSYFIEPDTGHVLSPLMWQKVREFFQQYLT
jgi:dienelactone hydrolase